MSLCPDKEPGHPERLQLLQKDHQSQPDKQHERESSQLVWSLKEKRKCGSEATRACPVGDEQADPPGADGLPRALTLLCSLLPPQLEIENEVNNEMANRMSLFYAEPMPMMKTLSKATTNFVMEVKCPSSPPAPRPSLRPSPQCRPCRTKVFHWRKPQTVSAPWPMCVESCWRRRESSHTHTHTLGSLMRLGGSKPVSAAVFLGSIRVASAARTPSSSV